MTESTAAAARAVLLSDAPLLGRLYSDWLAGDAELSAALASSTLDPFQFHASSAAAGLGESAPDLWEASSSRTAAWARARPRSSWARGWPAARPARSSPA